SDALERFVMDDHERRVFIKRLPRHLVYRGFRDTLSLLEFTTATTARTAAAAARRLFFGFGPRLDRFLWVTGYLNSSFFLLSLLLSTIAQAALTATARSISSLRSGFYSVFTGDIHWDVIIRRRFDDRLFRNLFDVTERSNLKIFFFLLVHDCLLRDIRAYALALPRPLRFLCLTRRLLLLIDLFFEVLIEEVRDIKK